jgi:hypothetical protein
MDSNELKAQMVLKGKTVTGLIQELNKIYSVKMSKSSFYKKLNGTNEFKINEILAMYMLLEMNIEQLQQIFFNKKVS